MHFMVSTMKGDLLFHSVDCILYTTRACFEFHGVSLWSTPLN